MRICDLCSDVCAYGLKGIETGQCIITSGSYKVVLANSRMNKASTPFGVLKYLDEEERAKTQERNHSDTDYIIFRLGEVLLNYAEAAIELGHDGDALSAINQLRERAGKIGRASCRESVCQYV